MLETLYNCKIQFAGLLQSVGNDGTVRPAVFPTGGAVTATVQIDPTSATYTTAAIAVKRGNRPQGPWFALESAANIAAPGGMSAAFDCSGFAYIALDVTTGEGSDVKVNATVYLNDKPR